MAYLGDLVGQLMAEMTLARVQADIESIRIAEMYADHDLLKHFPVPRVRLPDVHVELPVVYVGMEGQPLQGRKFPSASDITDAFVPRAVERLQSAGHDLSERRSVTLKSRLMTRAKPFDQRKEVPVNTVGLSSDLADEVLRILNKTEQEKMSRRARGELLRDLKRLVRLTATEMQPQTSRLEVAVTPEALREAGDAVIRLQLSISEEGLEWTSIETDEGLTRDLLVLE